MASYSDHYVKLVQLGIDQRPVEQVVAVLRRDLNGFVELHQGILDLVELELAVALGGVVTGVVFVQTDGSGEVMAGFQEISELHQGMASRRVEPRGAFIGALNGAAGGANGFGELLNGFFDFGFGLVFSGHDFFAWLKALPSL